MSQAWRFHVIRPHQYLIRVDVLYEGPIIHWFRHRQRISIKEVVPRASTSIEQFSRSIVLHCTGERAAFAVRPRSYRSLILSTLRPPRFSLVLPAKVIASLCTQIFQRPRQR